MALMPGARILVPGSPGSWDKPTAASVKETEDLVKRSVPGGAAATGITVLQAEAKERKAAAQATLDFLNVTLDLLGEPARTIDEYQGDPDQRTRDINEALKRVWERGYDEGRKEGRRYEREKADKEAAVEEGREAAVALRERLVEAERRVQVEKQRADGLAAARTPCRGLVTEATTC